MRQPQQCFCVRYGVTIRAISGREGEVITLVCQGLRNKEIARKLGVSEHTVKARLNQIFKKFHITGRSQLIALALDRRLCSS